MDLYKQIYAESILRTQIFNLDLNQIREKVSVG